MNSFVVYVYLGNHVKEFVLQHMTDGRKTLNLYAYETGVPEDISIVLDVSNSVWKIISHDTVKIVKAGKHEKESLIRPDETVNLVYVKGSANIKITVLPMEKNEALFNFSKYYCQSMKEITIGRAAGNIIMFDAPSVSSKHAVINFESSGVYIKDVGSQNGVYVNRQKVSSAKLSFGDIILIMGLKIVYLDNFIGVNNPKSAVKCKIFQHIKTPFIDEETEEISVNSSSNYFVRSPRIEKKLRVETEEIDSPPFSKGEKSMPLLLVIGPSLTMSLAMVAGVAFTLNAKDNNPAAMIPSIVTTVAMLLGAVLWPILSQRHNKKTAEKEESQRLQKYREYIHDTYVRLQEMLEHNRSVLLDTYPPLETCVERINHVDRRIWERSVSHDDFLDLRIGSGVRPFTVQINMPRERFSVDDDPLKKEMASVADQFQYITNVPISVPFTRESMVGLIGGRKELIDLVRCLTIQLTALHSYDEVKLIYIYNENEENIWSFAKWLPHVWTAGKMNRYIATVQDEVREIFLWLSTVLNKRKEEQDDFSAKKKNVAPHYVIFVAEPKLIENEPVIKMLMDEQENLGVTLVLLYKEINMLPNQCNTIIQCAENTCSVYYKNDPSGKMHTVDTDTSKNINIMGYAKQLFKIRIKEQLSEASLPASVTFLGMYEAGSIEDLIIEKRWGTSEPFKTLEAPVGIASANQIFHLNVHEKYHGPHGLIAGMTGSGKSEFVQSYILSMAVNYHPYDVSFILIDYKGGGMANCFTGIPHVAGMITNLGGNSIHRSLVSLQSELKRRQRLLAEINVNHIDKYQQMWKEGKANEPLPHLVIISDEFAELKSQQPEFMRELVSAARIGRSLGVHLILATQKPSGVVDDQIWSNTRFRVCLKVLDKMDSNEMLKRQEASLITIPGRCYVQVGNDEIFEMVQSAWSGAPYFPSDKVENVETKTIHLLDNCGRVLRKASAVQRVEKAADTQLGAVVDYISRYAQAENIKPLSLWLPPLENFIAWKDIETRQGGFDGEKWEKTEHFLYPAIGRYDDPSTQTQDALYINFMKDGHLTLFGAPSTGKTTFLQTLVYSLAQSYSPEWVSIYLLDFGGRSMGYFRELPHVGGIAFSDEEEKIEKLFKMLDKELNSRKKLFSDLGVGSLQSYLEAASNPLPAIFLMLDNMSAFSELYPDFEQELILLSREGANYGIYLVLTANNSGSIKYKIMQNIKLMLTLQLNDKFDYMSLVGQTNGLTPDSVKGRGLINLNYPVEYQTALAIPVENEAERTNGLKKIFAAMNTCWKGYRPKNIPMVPVDLSINTIMESTAHLQHDDSIMIGYDMEEAEPIFIDFKKTFIFTLLGGERTGKSNLLMCLSKYIKSQYTWKVWVFDNQEGTLKTVADECGVDEYCSDAESFDSCLEKLQKMLVGRNEDLKKAKKKNTVNEEEFMKKHPKIIVLLDGYEYFFDTVTDNGLNIFENIVKNAGHLNVHFIISANSAELSRYAGQPPYKHIFNGSNGLLLGGGLDTDTVYNVNASYQQRSMSYEAGQGYLINKSNFQIVKTPYYS